MQKIGLTGSIAVGKSYVCDIFRELGCHVLDADKTSREVVEPGTEGLRRIVNSFGVDILAADGSLDRKRLGAVVFADREKRGLLNSIVHPLVIKSQDEWLAAIEQREPESIAIVDAALLIESGGWKRFEKLIVVWCESAIQLQRLMLRDCLSKAEAQIRIESQMPQEEKKTFADHLIDTSGGHEHTRSQTVKIFNELKNTRRD